MFKPESKIDRVFRLPRIWSNKELLKFSHLFTGHVANVSGWTDVDKEGSVYKDYFVNAISYTITNFKSEARGFQGKEGEIFLDLTQGLPEHLIERFDVVFNHTVLEHIYEVRIAFQNLCKMTSDVAIIIVPFLQEMHAEYGDYWRFTPLTMRNLFEENGMDLIYCSFNSHVNSSVYLFCIGVKHKDKWVGKIPFKYDFNDPVSGGSGHQHWVGCHAIQNDEYLRSKRPSVLNRISRKFSFLLDKMLTMK